MFQLGDFTLASGQSSRWKIECDTLTDDDWDALAVMLVEQLAEPFNNVWGVPTGGGSLAAALWRHANDNADRILVVDDVWTTGASMRRFIKDHLIGDLGYDPDKIDRAVVFARDVAPATLTVLFRMSVWP